MGTQGLGFGGLWVEGLGVRFSGLGFWGFCHSVFLVMRTQ